MRKLLLVCSLIAFLLAFLAGCQCQHSWTEENCTTPKVCTKCNATSGDIKGHTWTSANCESPKTCTVCAATEGEALGHKWENATCTNPMVCSVCSEIAGEPLGHDWIEATCKIPSTCRTCNLTTGEALGHAVESWQTVSKSTCTETGTQQGVCSTCSETVTEALPIAEHTPSDWVVKVEPTENSSGTRVKNCTVCDKELEQETFTLTAEEIKARYKKRCKKISYKELARSPDNYKGEYVTFSGYVVQVCSEASSSFYYSTYRVATSGKYNNVVYIYVDNYGSGKRILEDDKITFYGTYDGLYSYTTVMGAKKTIPSIKVAYIN